MNLALLLALAGLLFFLNLGAMGLTDRDEGRNAEAGREMFESGDWVTPTFNDELRVAKPVFLYWLMSASYHLFGVSEFAARFPSALFGLALIAMQYLVLSRVRGPAVALFGSLMLLVNVEIISLDRMALTDSVLIFFTTLSLYGFWMGLHGEGWGRRCLWVFYSGMALATLTKGPVGVIVPFLTVALYLTVTQRWGMYWRHGYPLAGTLVFALLALPWYAAMLAIHGSAYADQAQVHTIGRFLSSMEGHNFSLFFYLPVLFFGFFPWSGFLPMALYQAFKDWRETAAQFEVRSSQFTGKPDSPQHLEPRTPNLESRTSNPPAPHELEWFAAIWVAVVFVFFTLSSTRLPHYIGPLFPAAALLTASYWSRGLLDPRTAGIRVSIHLTMGLGYLLALGFALLPWLYSKFLDNIAKEFAAASQLDLSDPFAGPYAAAAMLVMGMALVGYFGLYEARRAGAFWAAGTTIAVVVLIIIQFTLPQLNAYFIEPPQKLAYAAGLNLSPTDRFIAYGATRPSSVFYARRKTIFIQKGEEANILPHVTQPGRTMILLPATLRSKLPQETADFPIILQRFGYILLANKPMIDVPASQEPPPPKPLVIPGH